MIINRFYNRKRFYNYYFHPEIKTMHEFMAFSKANPLIDCDNLDNADYAIKLQTHEEQDSFWINNIRNIMLNTRQILDNLDFYCEYQVRWNHYGKQFITGPTVGKPPIKTTEHCEKYYNHIESSKYLGF